MRSDSAPFRRWYSRYKKSGELGVVRLGATPEEVREWFGEPDATSNEKPRQRRKGNGIWRYGIVEFHFFEGELRLVYSELPDLVPCVILSAQVDGGKLPNESAS
jgi:hypothetical protein